MFVSVQAAAYAVFVAGLAWHVLPKYSMFTRKHARAHRLTGLCLLVLLLLGGIDVVHPVLPSVLLYHLVLSLLGISTTLTAARDFASHEKAKNPASGALDSAATITLDEMMEHAFYQVRCHNIETANAFSRTDTLGSELGPDSLLSFTFANDQHTYQARLGFSGHIALVVSKLFSGQFFLCQLP